MAWTAHKDEEDLKEYEEPEEELVKKCKELAKLIKESKHFIMFTGAGVSTSAGIPDFRGPEGVWTLRATGGKRTKKSVSTLQAIPTYTHMSIVSLMKANKMNYLVSQNCDGLHRRSGVRKERISELHGNSNLEICIKCGKNYLRDFSVTRYGHVNDHTTGRKCDNPKCNGVLEDTIINFGEKLRPEILGKAFKHARKADLCISAGTSLTVTPASNVPLTVSRIGRKYVVINLQKTPHDKFATMKIHAKCDKVFELVMKELEMKPDVFKLRRKLRVVRNEKKDTLEIIGLDYMDSEPFDFIKGVRLCKKDKFKKMKKPFFFKKVSKMEKKEKSIPMEVMFHSNYAEPPVLLTVDLAVAQQDFNLEYDPSTGLWSTVKDPKIMSAVDGLTEEDYKDKEVEPVKCILKIGNSSMVLPKKEDESSDMWFWKVFVREIGTKYVKKVKFELLPTFKKSETVVVDSPNYDNEFCVERTGSSGFTVKIEIEFKKGGKKKFDHLLDFDSEKEIARTVSTTIE